MGGVDGCGYNIEWAGLNQANNLEAIIIIVNMGSNNN